MIIRNIYAEISSSNLKTKRNTSKYDKHIQITY